jgi:uncharacterized protein YjdB
MYERKIFQMKKRILSLFVLLGLLVVGCKNTTSSSSDADSSPAESLSSSSSLVVSSPSVSSSTDVSSSTPVVIHPTSVAVTGETTDLLVGATRQLGVTTVPTVVTHPEVSWDSTSTAVATVVDGLVTAIAPGSVAFTATVDGVSSAPFTLVVLPIVPTSVVVSTTHSGPFYIGETLQLSTEVEPANVTNPAVTYSSSAGSVLTVGATTGLVTAIGEGSATVTATVAGVHGYLEIDVSPILASSVSVTPAEEGTLLVGGTRQLSATVLPLNTTHGVEWASSDTAVATVSTSGLVTAVTSGTADITATVDEAVGTYNLVVKDLATSLGLTGSTVIHTVGGTTTLTVQSVPAGADYTDLGVVSSDPSKISVAIVDGAIVATAHKVGEVNISVTAKDVLGGAISTTASITSDEVLATGLVIGNNWSGSFSAAAIPSQSAGTKLALEIRANPTSARYTDLDITSNHPETISVALEDGVWTLTYVAVGPTATFTATAKDAEGTAISGTNTSFVTLSNEEATSLAKDYFADYEDDYTLTVTSAQYTTRIATTRVTPDGYVKSGSTLTAATTSYLGVAVASDGDYHTLGFTAGVPSSVTGQTQFTPASYDKTINITNATAVEASANISILNLVATGQKVVSFNSYGRFAFFSLTGLTPASVYGFAAVISTSGTIDYLCGITGTSSSGLSLSYTVAIEEGGTTLDLSAVTGFALPEVPVINANSWTNDAYINYSLGTTGLVTPFVAPPYIDFGYSRISRQNAGTVANESLHLRVEGYSSATASALKTEYYALLVAEEWTLIGAISGNNTYLDPTGVAAVYVTAASYNTEFYFYTAEKAGTLVTPPPENPDPEFSTTSWADNLIYISFVLGFDPVVEIPAPSGTVLGYTFFEADATSVLFGISYSGSAVTALNAWFTVVGGTAGWELLGTSYGDQVYKHTASGLIFAPWQAGSGVQVEIYKTFADYPYDLD